LLEQIDDPANAKTKFLNLSGLLHDPDPSNEHDRYQHARAQRALRRRGLDRRNILQEGATSSSANRRASSPATRSPTSTATLARTSPGRSPSNRESRPEARDDRPHVHRQRRPSLGAFLVQGVRLTLNGEANDYVAKGMAGGEIIIRPKPSETYAWKDNCIAGNTCLYGATGGALFAAGWAGERFGVRNSGATAVVEGVGDHGCEYMTGGVIAVLSRARQSFGAGMSGGLAFVYDDRNVLPDRASTPR